MTGKKNYRTSLSEKITNNKPFSLIASLPFIFIGSILLYLFWIHIHAVNDYKYWGIFHYYLGSKYLKEVGYFGLYTCALATKEPAWNEVKQVRNLYTYELIPYQENYPCPRENFSSTRWRNFVTDIEEITRYPTPYYWSAVVTDKGFNPPPSWAGVAGFLTNIFPLHHQYFYILMNFDLLFILFSAVLIWYSTGKFTGISTLFLSLLYFGTFGILGNNFLQYAWYPCIVLSIISWREKKYISSGVFLGVATILQIFPAIFAIPVTCFFIFSLFQYKLDRIKAASYFLLSFLIILLVGFIIGTASAEKTDIWQQWYYKITTHKNYLTGEIFNIGFPNLFATVISNDNTNSYSYPEDYPHTAVRNQRFIEYQTVYTSIFYFNIVILLLLVWRAKNNQPLIFGYFPMYMFFSLSPYYYLFLALLPFIFSENSLLIRYFVWVGIGSVFLLHFFIFSLPVYVSFIYNKHLISEVIVFIFITILSLLLLVEKKYYNQMQKQYIKFTLI